jgi:hypothetical protein
MLLDGQEELPLTTIPERFRSLTMTVAISSRLTNSNNIMAAESHRCLMSIPSSKTRNPRIQPYRLKLCCLVQYLSQWMCARDLCPHLEYLQALACGTWGNHRRA